MRIETFGSPDKPAMLFIPGMFCTAQGVRIFAQHMKTEAFFVLPTLSGHYAGAPDYMSKEAEAEAILNWLKERGVTRLALLHGTSMGAEVAMEVLRQAQGSLTMERCLFDGGPFFHFPWWFRRVMEGKFRQMAKLMRYDSPEEALDAIAKIPVVNRIIGKDREKYVPTFRAMMTEKRTISPVTVRNVTETCYNFKLPAFDAAMQQRMFFLYSDDEPAHMAKKRLQRAYPEAKYKDMHGLGHCGWQTSDPEGYAAMLDRYVQGEDII